MNKVNFQTKLYRKILRWLPTIPALYLIYFRGYKKILNLKNPKTWGEKIQWLKLNGNLEELTNYVDKYEVRKYISKTIGDEYLNKLYGVYDNINDIDFNSLPNKFVIKSTNGSGTIIICKDKKNFNIVNAKKEMKKWLTDKFYKEKKELQYKNIKNRIIIEEYLEDETGSLTDYKIYCFDGEPKYYGIFYDRYVDKKIDFYDKNGKKLNGVNTCHIKNSDKIEPFDDRIKNMFKLSKKLSKIFTTVRVDFYFVNNKIYFGELTFTDGAGSDPWYPESFDKKIASYIKLENVLKKENDI